MLTLEVIGNLGANAELRAENGKEYIVFNVAHTDRRTASDGQTVERATWVSCFLSASRRNILPYLVKGTRVFVRGLMSTRIYDSAVHHCKMVGLSLYATDLELCGSPIQSTATSEYAALSEKSDRPPF